MADPAGSTPKIAKIREHVQSLQLAYGEDIVLRKLLKTIFGNNPCELGGLRGEPNAFRSSASSNAVRSYGRASTAASISTTPGLGRPSSTSTLSSGTHMIHRPSPKGEWNPDEPASKGEHIAS